MGAFTMTLAGVAPPERLQRYQQLATSALAHYALDSTTPEFVGHNSGITYRVITTDPDQCFLLKIHDPIGEGPTEPVDHIHSRMAWLAELSHTTGLGIQEPVCNRDGTFVANMLVADIPHSLPCTLQRWILGDHPNGDLTIPQIETVGAMLGVLHNHSAAGSSTLGMALALWAAIANLAFQMTIPSQRVSPLFIHNLRQTTDNFCPKILANEPFACG